MRQSVLFLARCLGNKIVTFNGLYKSLLNCLLKTWICFYMGITACVFLVECSFRKLVFFCLYANSVKKCVNHNCNAVKTFRSAFLNEIPYMRDESMLRPLNVFNYCGKLYAVRRKSLLFKMAQIKLEWVHLALFQAVPTLNVYKCSWTTYACEKGHSVVII